MQMMTPGLQEGGHIYEGALNRENVSWPPEKHSGWKEGGGAYEGGAVTRENTVTRGNTVYPVVSVY